MVGLGEVYNTSGHEMLHNRPIPPNHVKVGIKVVFPGEGATSLPVPIDEAVTIDEAIGTCVAWPVNLIILYHLVRTCVLNFVQYIILITIYKW